MQSRTISDQREPSLSKERELWSSKQEKRGRRERRSVVHLGVCWSGTRYVLVFGPCGNPISIATADTRANDACTWSSPTTKKTLHGALGVAHYTCEGK
jgi:hypothetical protein